ncbi:MAG: phosphocholine cytidylyltransferase family protein [Alphaproteobacteria bacterium]
MKAIILAAGRGSRMGGLTGDRPKCMVELAGRPLLDWQRAALGQAGVEAIGVVRGYRGESFDPFPLTAFDNPRWSETNMVVSLTCAAAWLRAGPCVVSYADIFYPPAAVRALMAAAADIAITYDRDWLALWSQRFADPLSDAETFRVDDAGRVIDIGRRPSHLGEVEGQYMGLLKITPAGFAAIERLVEGLEPAARDRLDMTSLLSRLIAGGTVVRGVAVDGPWGEVDNATDLAVYEAMVASGRITPPSLD